MRRWDAPFEVVQPLGERRPVTCVRRRPRILLNRLGSQLPELRIGKLRTGHPDHLSVCRQQAGELQVVEGRQEFSAGKVSSDTDDHDILVRRPFECHRVFTGWPPNSFRSAAITRIENAFSSLEVNRAKSGCASTPTLTPRSTASRTVHRPSPESST